MTATFYPELGEQVFTQTLPNGLRIFVVPRPGFKKKLCYYTADYGSIHRCFTLDGKAIEAPMGVAHYLEHKLFDMPGRDICEEFAALGASPNAFTGYDMTAYYFSCTDHFDRCLRLLLEFVSTPYFTEESVEKERGIITQEILMNKDNPDTVIFEQQAAAMYENHPVTEPILGTEESVRQITAQILADCHRAFYHPSNMILCVVGDVDPEAVAQTAQEVLPDTPAPDVQRRRSWEETMTCKKALVESQMEVAMPTFQLCFKSEDPGMGEASVLQEIIGELAAEALFGESSPLYMELYEQGLIDSSFGGGFDTMEGLSMLVAGGDSDDPQAVKDRILSYAQILSKTILPEEDFLRMKRSALGRRIRGLDSFDSVCFRLCAYQFSKFDFFRLPMLYRQVKQEDIRVFLEKTVTAERSCLSVIHPL